MENKDILIFSLNQPLTGGYLFDNKNMFCHVKAGVAFINWVYVYKFSDFHLKRINLAIEDEALSNLYFIPKDSIFNSKVMIV